MEYSWAVNKTKLARAIQFVKEQETKGGAKFSEQAVKDKYISLLGLVVETGEVVKEVVEKAVKEIQIKKIKGKK